MKKLQNLNFFFFLNQLSRNLIPKVKTVSTMLFYCTHFTVTWKNMQIKIFNILENIFG